MKRFINHIKRQFRESVGYVRLLLLLPVACSVTSCLDNTMLSSVENRETGTDNADIYLSINIPSTYASGDAYDKETEVETLDVLVFAKGEVETNKYFVHTACKGTLTTNANTFQVVMPVGNDFLIHVFINCHDDMVAKGFYNSRGTELNAMLDKLTTGVNSNTTTATSLPMHGYVTGIDIDKDKVGTTITVPVLRAVAAAQVMTKVSVTGEGALVPGTVANFELREAYLYFYPDSGRIAPLSEAYTPLNPSEDDETRDVIKVSLPANHQVSDTRQNEIGKPKPYSITESAPVNRLGTFYLYENKPWSSNGVDQPPVESKPVATTRLVVGGVYNNETTDGVTPKVTYYRVDFAESHQLTEILRNHKYTFSIESVSGSGYDSPDDAALGMPMNIYVNIIDWTDELENVDFDRQNHFYSSTKHIEMPRDTNSERSVTVESDVPVSEWELSFKTTANGTATTAPDGYSISNDRYKVEKASDGTSLIFTVLKPYSDSSGSLNEVLIIKAHNLKIVYTITQLDKSPDDWGNGGDLETELGE